ncbi:hypothetical protein ACFQPA_19975 [Halomarina halobia]|uniref:Rad51-like C-terminal domain-containing protein n=1 Tax=Halomarina halobia TaxID=3033386 RepID=A0ABD6AFM7_9EURY|nr:hypothetical protein [Halomarina sp. PSR21]
MRHNTTGGPDLPALGSGIQLLDTEDEIVGPLQSLVVDHLLLNEGCAYWVDSHGHATTSVLTRLAPSDRFLDRIHVARGFTPGQHYQLVNYLCEHLAETGGEELTLLVCPALDGQYRADELHRGEGETMLLKTLARLAGLAREYDVPVLVTRQQADELSAPITSAAVETIHCEQTQFGPRFTADGFETLVYPDRGYLQTTLAFWERVLQTRHATAYAGKTRQPAVVGWG